MSKISPVWHPMTQHKIAGPAFNVESAEGIYLHGRDGDGIERSIIDGISSWWVNTHGHCHPTIVEAVRGQAGKLEQVVFAGFTHDTAERLTRKLLSTVRAAFDGCEGRKPEFCFYSDSGSTAVEVAIKMAVGYFKANGQKRNRILAMDGAYHGDTFGAMSASSRGIFNEDWADMLFDVTHLPFPEQGNEVKTFQALERYLKKHGKETAGFVFEPIVQGSVGFRMYSPMVLQKMAQMCREYDVLLIADEVMTGFGRTGTMFASAQAAISPDLMCLSKGLTGGFLPMGATLASKEIYKAFYRDEKGGMFLHSTSFTGNALSCAAAMASLKIWDDEPVLERIQNIENAHRTASSWFGVRPDVKEVRVKGTIFAVEVSDEKAGYLSDVAGPIYNFMMANNVLLRPIGNVVYILPPYCIEMHELERIYDSLWRALDHLRDLRAVDQGDDEAEQMPRVRQKVA
ncbi:MAG: adenosylmethionine--8-amino-7-oxononanoate transaminase [Micavibrio sp.]|nr:adenosylmethionine--8-amino-7-oxononanoate transaminase [Micavibrio sp.]